MSVVLITDFFFLTAAWQLHGQLWAIVEGKASLTQCQSLHWILDLTRRSPGTSYQGLVPKPDRVPMMNYLLVFIPRSDVRTSL